MSEGDRFSFYEKGTFPRRVALASYPRSGNSLLRRLLEEVTGAYTGSDTSPERVLAKQLLEFGMMGEGIVDSSVWFVKSHFPERRGHRPFACDRAIVVVRNPLDAIDSYFNMVLTMSHTNSIAESEYARFSDAWDDFVRVEADQWTRFHNHWLNAPVPVLFLRFEDLVNPSIRPALLRRALSFAQAGSSAAAAAELDPAAVQARVAAASASAQQGRVYKPRSGVVGGSLGHYSQAQAAAVLAATWHTLHALGYGSLPAEVAAVHGEAAACVHPPPVAAVPTLPDAVRVLCGEAEAVAEAEALGGRVLGTEPNMPNSSLASVNAARKWLATPASLLGSVLADKRPPPPSLAVHSGTVVMRNEVLVPAAETDDDTDQAKGMEVVADAVARGRKHSVNTSYQLRPCTSRDPWGRGMKWVDHLGITDDHPVVLRTKAPAKAAQ